VVFVPARALEHEGGGGDELPPVRDIPKATIDKWVADDEEGYRKFLAGA
jgi:hypothetical protein